MNKVIAIRADGNSDIGFGHLIRTMALARQLERCGAKVIFLSQNPENIRNYTVEQINSGSDLAVEDTEVERILQQSRADMLIIDSYAYQQARLDRVASLDLLSVYIDDINLYEFNVDFVANGNLYAPRLKYRGKARQLLGSDYLILREEFTGLSARKPNRQLRDVLITFGAADMENVTPELLKLITGYEHFKELNWHVVIGPVFRNSEEIESIVGGYPNMFLCHNPAIKDLMSNCDIAVSAAGSTTYELAASGVPAILTVVADNQLMLAEEAHRQGMAINLGWYQNLDPARLFSALDSMINNHMLREKMAVRGRVLIDGRGAQRLATVLLDEMKANEQENNCPGNAR